MRVLVTGATGFVGLNLARSLADGPHDPVAFVRPGAPVDRLPTGVETVEGDLLAPERLRAAADGVDAVVHLGARVYPGADMARVNVEGTENVRTAATDADVERVVFTSTIGAHPAVPIDPESTYQTSKAEADRRLLNADAFDVSVLYPTYVFGPLDYRLTRYEHFEPVANNRVLAPPLYTYADYNVVHVADVVRSVEYCLGGRSGERTGRFVISGPNVDHVDVLRAVAASLSTRCRVVPVPYPVTKYAIAPAIDLAHRWGVSPVGGDAFLEREDYGRLPTRLTERAPVDREPWRAAIADTAAWYRRVGVL